MITTVTRRSGTQTGAARVLHSNFMIADLKITFCGFCGTDITTAAFSEWEAWADKPMCKQCSDELDQQHSDANTSGFDDDEDDDYSNCFPIEDEEEDDCGITDEDLAEFRARNEERGTAYGWWY